MVRIGIFSDTYFPQISGVSTSIQTLTNELEQRGHDVYIFTTTDPKAKEHSKIIRLPSIPFVNFKDRRIAVRGLDHALKLARQYKLDIIHTQTEFSLGLLGLFIAGRLSIPVIHTYHTMYEKYTHYILDGELIQREHVGKLSNLFCSQADAVVVPSNQTKLLLESYGITVPISVIPTGVTIPRFQEKTREVHRTKYGFTQDDIVLLSLSRLSEEKRIDEIIEQFDNVCKLIPDAHLIIVGDGPHREYLEALAQSQLNKEHIYFVGEVSHSEVHHYYQMADVFVSASDSETQGLTYIEALVNRLPVVALSNDYLSEIIQQNKKYGLLFTEISQYPETLAKFIEIYKTFGRIDPTALYQISSQRFGDEIISLYETLIDQTPNYQRGLIKKTKHRLLNFIRHLMIGENFVE